MFGLKTNHLATLAGSGSSPSLASSNKTILVPIFLTPPKQLVFPLKRNF
jgi:hypothetical protein